MKYKSRSMMFKNENFYKSKFKIKTKEKFMSL